MDSYLVEILFGAFFGLLILGAPITVALGVSSLAAMLYLGDNPIKMVQMAWSAVGSFPLMALPAFILAGALMEAAGLSRRLINVAEKGCPAALSVKRGIELEYAASITEE